MERSVSHGKVLRQNEATSTKSVSLITNVEVSVMAHQSDSLWLLRHEVSSIPPEMQLEPGRKG